MQDVAEAIDRTIESRSADESGRELRDAAKRWAAYAIEHMAEPLLGKSLALSAALCGVANELDHPTVE